MAQGCQLLFEVSEFAYALVHMVNVLIKDRVDRTAPLRAFPVLATSRST